MNEHVSFGNWMYKNLCAIKYVPTKGHMEPLRVGLLEGHGAGMVML